MFRAKDDRRGATYTKEEKEEKLGWNDNNYMMNILLWSVFPSPEA